VKARETIVIPAGTTYYYTRTKEECEDIRQRDIATGNNYDSAGEPKIYSRITSSRIQENTFCTIIKNRNIEWDTWFNKPSHLLEVLATINGAPRIILVKDPRRVQSQHQKEFN